MLRALVPRLTFKPDELYRVPTADGSAVALGRYYPRGVLKFREPVVLAHGLGANRFSLDFDERYSLARFLARQGFESWVLELRGHGLAGSAKGSSFDVEARYDVAAALSTVCSTGASSVLWVGHSRGGLIAYAHLGRFPDAPISAIVTVGSPVAFDASAPLRSFVAALGPALALEVIPLRAASRTGLLLGLPPNPIGKFLVRRENMEPAVIRRVLANVTADVPGGVARAFARWIRTGTFDGDDGLDYRAALGRVKVPIFSLAGSKDFLSPPSAAHAVARHAGGPVETLVLGPSGGLPDDYGHGDAVLGVRSPEEVFPRIADFLARHATPVTVAR